MTIATRRRGVALLAAGLLVAAGVTACSSSSGPSSAPTALSTDPASVKGELAFSTWWAYANQDLVKGFAQKYPNVKVTLDFTPIDTYPQHIQTLASSGKLPDVFAAQTATLVALQKAGALMNLKEALQTTSYDQAQPWGQTFVPTLLAGANSDFPSDQKADGQVYGVPFNAISIADIYNKDVFAKVGIQPATTFDQLLSNCGKLKAAGYIPMSLTGKVWIDWWVHEAWDQTMAGESPASFSVSDPHYVKGFAIMKQIADAGCWAPSQVSTDIAGEQALFVQQKTAQFISVPENFLGTIAGQAKFPLATAPLPPLDGKTPNRVMGGGNANVLVVNAHTKNPSAAIAFAKYLTSVQVESGLSQTQYTIPSINITTTSGNPLMKAYTDAAANGFVTASEYMPSFTPAGNTTLLSNVLPALVLGKLSPAQAAAATKDLFQN